MAFGVARLSIALWARIALFQAVVLSPNYVPDCYTLEDCVSRGVATPGMNLQLTQAFEVRRLLTARRTAVAALGDRPPVWRARQAWVRRVLASSVLHPLEVMARQLVGFRPAPRETRRWTDPLGFEVRLFTLETRPRLHMPCAFFAPVESAARFGALFVSGHDAASFRMPQSLHIILNLVLSAGIAVLACDPPSQGERHQYRGGGFAPQECEPTEGGYGSMPACTGAHNVYGLQALLLNASLASFMVWDALRAIDHLASLVPGPLGMVGCSGGGDITAYVAALDERVQAAALACWFTSWGEMIDKQVCHYDAEQLWPRGLAAGLDKADLVAAIAPRRAMIFQGMRDGCNPLVLEAQQEVERAFAMNGALGHLRWYVDNAAHGWHLAHAQPLVEFFAEAAGHPPRRLATEDLAERVGYLDLLATATGQLLNDPAYRDAATIPQLIAEMHSDAPRPPLEAASYRSWLATALPRMALEASGLPAWQASGSRVPAVCTLPIRLGTAATPCPRPCPPCSGPGTLSGRDPLVEGGLSSREGWAIRSAGACITSLKLYIPSAPNASADFAVLLVGASQLWSDHLEGHAAELACAVLAVGVPLFSIGLCGFGNHLRTHLADSAHVLLGRPLVGLHAAEIIAAARLAASLVPGFRLFVAALGEVAPAALHAVVAEPAAFGGLALVSSIAAYALVARSLNGHDFPWYALVPGVLQHYDLPDLAAALCPMPLLIYDPVGAHRRPLEASENHIYARVVEVYVAARAAERFVLTPATSTVEAGHRLASFARLAFD